MGIFQYADLRSVSAFDAENFGMSFAITCLPHAGKGTIALLAALGLCGVIEKEILKMEDLMVV